MGGFSEVQKLGDFFVEMRENDVVTKFTCLLPMNDCEKSTHTRLDEREGERDKESEGMLHCSYQTTAALQCQRLADKKSRTCELLI